MARFHLVKGKNNYFFALTERKKKAKQSCFLKAKKKKPIIMDKGPQFFFKQTFWKHTDIRISVVVM